MAKTFSEIIEQITYLFILLLFALISCSRDINTEIIDSINLFDKNEAIYFSNINVVLIRKSGIIKKSETFYANRKGCLEGRACYAYFETKPKTNIFRNFTSDTLTNDFVMLIKKLDITRLTNIDQITILEKDYNKYKLVFFKDRTIPFLTPENNVFISSSMKPIHLISNWYYIKIIK